MPIYYLDSSAAVKKYVKEVGTSRVVDLFRNSASDPVYVSQIVGVEIVSAITRRFRGGDLTEQAAQRALERFRRDFQSRLRILRLTDGVVSEAMLVAETYGLRAYDAVQLAVSLELRRRSADTHLPLTFVSSDDELNQAARIEGLTVEDPNLSRE